MELPTGVCISYYYNHVCDQVKTILPKNECFFSILRGRKLSEFAGVSEFCEDLYSKHIRSPLLLSLMVDIYEERAAADKTTEHAQNYLTKALGVRYTVTSALLVVNIPVYSNRWLPSVLLFLSSIAL